jgi:phytoene/squalene synthetase
MKNKLHRSQKLAASITKAASRQTYYTIRFLVDRKLVPAAYQAYAYFRWVDDRLDQEDWDKPQRMAFIDKQITLVDACYSGNWPSHLEKEERLLVDLVRQHPGKENGLFAYIHNMMAVMTIDARRRGSLITQAELNAYTHNLAVAVTEALHYFIGHNCASPDCAERYLAATAAHITHMLRDTHEDIQAGYFNIPVEYLEKHGMDAFEVDNEAYRSWVIRRTWQARTAFKKAKYYLSQVKNLRCRLAGYAYIARFETVLEAIEKDDYRLRQKYSERKRPGAVLKMCWSVLSMAIPGGLGEHLSPNLHFGELEEG